MLKRIFAVISIILILSSLINAEENDKKEKLNSGNLRGLSFRSVGPALTSGRISDIAVNPQKSWEYYVAVASGGIWKTTNDGTTFQPVFDSQGSYSIGCLTIDPENPYVIWAGTGENNSQRSVGYGDGVYKSQDGGKSWKNMGLKESEHIGKIIVDPRNSNVVYVAAQGPLWNAGGDRGLFKTTDGGESWEKVLGIDKHTGVSDIVFDPRNPDVLYASSYQRRRHVFTLINGGPGSAVHKSTDGGKTWNKLTKGLPGGDVGRIGLAISPANPDYLYAIVEASEKRGGFFRSVNRGATWKKMNSYIARSPQYYMEILCDPVNPDKVYSLDTWTKVTLDGGKTFSNVSTRNRHVDDHAMWINPANPDHYIIGGDGGIYETYDNAASWRYKRNLPVTQFYKVAVDNETPFYYIYGGTQDNNSLGGPSRTTYVNGIFNSDWFITNGGDGFESAIDPKDPNIVYAQSQYGWLNRYNKKTGEKIGIKPQEESGEEAYRWNWDAPLIISPHLNTRLYFAANILFRSDDRGESWTKVSDDLTRKIDRNKLPVMGRVWSMDAVSKNASTSQYGNIVALDESPIKEGLIYVGTDDGLIQVTADGGKKWIRYDSFPDVPDTTYVNSIIASQHKEGRLYAAFNNHKRGDFKPYILVSEDNGKSWDKIVEGLPERGSVYSLAEDHVNENLLFCGTEFAFYFSPDRGKKWIKLSAGLPTIAVRDIAIQKRENDIVVASFGRGFYVMDDYSPLRTVSEELMEKQAHIFPVKDALAYVQARPIGGGDKGYQGDALYTADNPQFGAVFTYYINEAPKTKKQLRKKSEKELKKDNKAIPYPAFNEIRAEDDEESSFLIFSVSDMNGNILRRLKAPYATGVQRTAWDLRSTTTNPADEENGLGSGRHTGHPVMPGKYKVTILESVDGVISPLAGPEEFTVKTLYSDDISENDSRELAAFWKEFNEFNRVIEGTNGYFREIQRKVKIYRNTLAMLTDNTDNLIAETRQIMQELKDINRKLYGDGSLGSRNIGEAPSINGRLNTIGYELWRTSTGPTETQRKSLAAARDELRPIIGQLKKIDNEKLRKIENELEKMNAPWTPGRVLELK